MINQLYINNSRSGRECVSCATELRPQQVLDVHSVAALPSKLSRLEILILISIGFGGHCGIAIALSRVSAESMNFTGIESADGVDLPFCWQF